MCGIVGVVSSTPVNQLIYDSLLLLQHRGQDAAGIATANGSTFHYAQGQRPGARCVPYAQYAQPARPAGIGRALPDGRFGLQRGGGAAVLRQRAVRHHPAHNGNLTNWQQLREEMFRRDRRHINTHSDTEVLLNVLADELQRASNGTSLAPDTIFTAVAGMHRRVRGSYAIAAQIAGYGMLAVRDPFGIRPLCLGSVDTPSGKEWMVASESVALEGIGYRPERDVAPGEAIFIDLDGKLHSKQCADNPLLNSCIFEYVYRRARIRASMACPSMMPACAWVTTAEKIRREVSAGDIDVVMPIPDSSRPAAMQVANKLGVGYREGFFKNRYVGRTFIMPGRSAQEVGAPEAQRDGRGVQGKNVLIVDDSIVRGTTSFEIVQMARDAGANKVIFASAAPPVKFPTCTASTCPPAASWWRTTAPTKRSRASSAPTSWSTRTWKR